MAHQYFNEELTGKDFVAGNIVHFGGEESRHAVRVSRLRAGEQVKISNGTGSWGMAEVIEAEPSSVTAKLLSYGFDDPATPKIVLVQALAKGDRNERAIEQATEFGVDEVIGWEAKRSITRWDETKRQKNLLKWQRIAREAAKQSLRSRIPQCKQILSTTQLLENYSPETHEVVVLDPRATKTVSEVLYEQLQTRETGLSQVKLMRDLVFIVGPEGGITADELATFQKVGFKSAVMGKNVMRTSSAGAAAIAVTNTLLGRW